MSISPASGTVAEVENHWRKVLPQMLEPANEIHEDAAFTAPPALASVAIAGLYVVAVVLAALTIVMAVVAQRLA